MVEEVHLCLLFRIIHHIPLHPSGDFVDDILKTRDTIMDVDSTHKRREEQYFRPIE